MGNTEDELARSNAGRAKVHNLGLLSGTLLLGALLASGGLGVLLLLSLGLSGLLSLVSLNVTDQREGEAGSTRGDTLPLRLVAI